MGGNTFAFPSLKKKNNKLLIASGHLLSQQFIITSPEHRKLLSTSLLGCICFSTITSPSKEVHHFSRTTCRIKFVLCCAFIFQANVWRVKPHFTWIAWQLSGYITWDGVGLYTCFVNKKIEIPRESLVWSNPCLMLKCFFPLKCKIWKLFLLLLQKAMTFPSISVVHVTLEPCHTQKSKVCKLKIERGFVHVFFTPAFPFSSPPGLFSFPSSPACAFTKL